jgi:N6-adenosine-specific RNA methylase IME4
MNRTDRVNGPFKRLKIIRQVEKIRQEPPPLPGRGPYRGIVADPPWPYEKRTEDPSNRATYPYPQMSIAQICEVDVASIANEHSALWLWTTNLHMREAFAALDVYGFEAKTILTWDKSGDQGSEGKATGCGDWLRGQTEHCILATRGHPIVQLTNQTTLSRAKRRGHSVKPVEFYDLVESLCPAPRYAYLFSRYRHNEKLDCHGDEAPVGDEVEPGERAAAE